MKSFPVFEILNRRNMHLKRACQYSRSIYAESNQWTHQDRVNFQQRLLDPDYCLKPEMECVPVLPKFGGELKHFYNAASNTYYFHNI